jgi:membrane-bound ClpP family serine protease
VVSQGEYIEAGAAIVVVRVDGNRIVVRRDRGGAGKE